MSIPLTPDELATLMVVLDDLNSATAASVYRLIAEIELVQAERDTLRQQLAQARAARGKVPLLAKCLRRKDLAMAAVLEGTEVYATVQALQAQANAIDQECQRALAASEQQP